MGVLFAFWRRRRDSNPGAFWANGFQDRLVMTTSIRLRISILFNSQARLQEKRARNAKIAIIEKSVNPYGVKV